jgi:hypothetical protein
VDTTALLKIIGEDNAVAFAGSHGTFQINMIHQNNNNFLRSACVIDDTFRLFGWGVGGGRNRVFLPGKPNLPQSVCRHHTAGFARTGIP